MTKRTKIIVIVIVAAIAVYLVYRWWSNRQASTGTDTTGFGSNLNSVAPDLVGGSVGPDSGLNYYPGNEQVDINIEGQPQSTPSPNPPPPYPKPKPHPKPKRKPKSGWKVSNRPPIVKPGARP